MSLSVVVKQSQIPWTCTDEWPIKPILIRFLVFTFPETPVVCINKLIKPHYLKWKSYILVLEMQNTFFSATQLLVINVQPLITFYIHVWSAVVRNLPHSPLHHIRAGALLRARGLDCIKMRSHTHKCSRMSMACWCCVRAVQNVRHTELSM